MSNPSTQPRFGSIQFAGGGSFQFEQDGQPGVTPLLIVTNPLPLGQVGAAYSGKIQASGGTPPYHWKVVNAPPGIDISYFSGEIYGWPPTSGAFSPDVTVTDSSGKSSNQGFTLVIQKAAVQVRFSPAVKAALVSMSQFFTRASATFYQLFNACQELTKFEPRDDPQAASCGLQATLYVTHDLLALSLIAIAAKDPADPNFTVIEQPTIPPLNLMPPKSTWTAAQLRAYGAFVNVIETTNTLLALTRATITSINRAEGAHEAANPYWEQQQVLALQNYTGQTAFQLRLLLIEQAQFEALLGPASGFPAIAITADQAALFSTTIAALGLPLDVQQGLTLLGVDSEGLAITSKAWSSFPPMGISGDSVHTLDSLIDPAEKVISALANLPPGMIVVPSERIWTTASGLGYSRVTRTFNGIVVITNISMENINGPFHIGFGLLTGGVILVNASGVVNGIPVIAVSSALSLAPGQSASVDVQFSDPSSARITFIPQIYSGSFN